MTKPVLAAASVVLWLAVGRALLQYSRHPEKVRTTVERRGRLYAGANLFRDTNRQVEFEIRLSFFLAIVFFALAAATVIAVVWR